MSFTTSAVLLLFVLTVWAVQQGESIHCWVCSSDVDPRCGDPFNTTQHMYLVSDCDRDRSHTPYLRNQAVCRKFKHKVNGETVIVRSCTWGNDNEEEGPCSSSALPPTTQLEYCSTCNTDQCNGSFINAPTAEIIFLILAPLISNFIHLL
ncbi:UPAR/Ly6 domain-containing protein crok-like [Rhodnius prolixus]|uniref:UPAR/Ly6 domain-containing protein crok-like n=1 Tax=Rhodnius prolixus TaxID=13249 RepID=UPI003D18990C